MYRGIPSASIVIRFWSMLPKNRPTFFGIWKMRQIETHEPRAGRIGATGSFARPIRAVPAQWGPPHFFSGNNFPSFLGFTNAPLAADSLNQLFL